jgi:hypothetical protein
LKLWPADDRHLAKEIIDVGLKTVGE